MMNGGEYRGKHAGSPDKGDRPPWMVHPKKRRIKMPKTFRKVLIAVIILAVAAAGIYIYLMLNPDVARTATIR